MELQQKQKKVTQNPLLNQFKIIKQKLQQRGSSIIQLNKQLRIQRNAMIQVLSQFQAHQKRIMNRLKRLEQINFKYIKQYAQLKKIAPSEEFSLLMSDKLYDTSSREVLIKKIEHYKQYYSEVTQNANKNNSPAFDITVSNVCGFIKSYLVEKQIDYQKTLQKLLEQKRKQLKEVKGLESYKANKQQQKIIDSLKTKILKYKQALPTLNQSNLIQIFNVRKLLESQILALDPTNLGFSLDESLKQQKMFSELIQEIVMLNAQDYEADHIIEVFLKSQFKFVQDATLKLAQEYGEDFINESINKIETLSIQMKEGIARGLSRKELVQIARRQRRQRQSKNQQNGEFVENLQTDNNYLNGFTQNKNINRHRNYKQLQRDEDQLKEQNFDLTQQQRADYRQEKIRIKNYKGNVQSRYDQQNQLGEQSLQNQGLLLEKSHSKVNKKASKASKLNAAFQSTMTKSFFQQQQKTRDSLIAKQNTELHQHQKVIHKLITFIKKEFKQKKLDDIDADDPEQLMGYYFKVNQKKYIDIKEQLQEIEKEKKQIEQQKNQQIEQLTLNQEILQNQNKDLIEKKTILESQTRQLIQEIKVIQVNLIAQQENVMQLAAECQNLRLKFELQKLQIVALSQIYQQLKANTIQYHKVTQSTENIVKLSLQTVFNLCLNKLKPQQIIQRLERIIQIIKVNVKLKCDLIYDLSFSKFINKEQENAKNGFTKQLTQGLRPYKDSSNFINKDFVEDFLNIEGQNKQIEIIDKPQTPKSFLDCLREIEVKMVENEIQQSEICEEQNQENHKAFQQNQISQNLVQPIGEFNFGNIFMGVIKLFDGKVNQSQNKSESAGIDQNFIDGMIENLKKIKQNKVINDQEDIIEMYQKYKQAVKCLQRSQRLNKEYEKKYQDFLNDLKKKGAYEAPQMLQEKLFYMQRVINQQDELLQSQRKQYEDTILKQIQKSEKLAQSVLENIKLSRKKANAQKQSDKS